VNRARVRRLATVLMVAVVATAMSTGVVTAGQTRILDIRSPGQANAGDLSFSQVSAGGATLTTIQITNTGKQTLTKGHLLIGLPPATALAADVTIAEVAVLQGSATCTWSSGGSTVDCDLGSLTAKGPGKSRLISVAFNIGNQGNHTIDAAVKVAETVQDVGSNRNYELASGSIAAGAASCDSLATYLVSNRQDVTLLPTAADCSSDSQRSSLLLKKEEGSALVTIDDSAALACPADLGVTCFGNTVQANVNNGADIEPYLTWFVTYSAELMQSINPKQVGFVHDGVLIPAGKKGACGDGAFTSDCIVGYTPNDDGSVTFEIRTETNTTMRGAK
jgi:hypothetical protein